MLADFVVGMGNLCCQAERGAKDFLSLATEVFPGGFLLLDVEPADLFAKLAHARMVLHQLLAEFPCNFFQFRGH